MHLLYLHQYFTTPEKGGGTRSYEFARRLVARGHQVTMITGNSRLQEELSPRDRWKEIEIKGIRVIIVPVDYSNYMEKQQRIRSFLRYAWLAVRAGWSAHRHNQTRGSGQQGSTKQKYSRPALVFASSTPLTAGIPGIILALRFRVPLIFEVRDLWPEAPVQMGVFRNRFLIAGLRLLEKIIYRFARHIVALSPGMAEGVRRQGVKNSRVTVIPNSSDTGLFSPGSSDPEFNAQWRLEGRFVVAYAGAMGEANGLDLIGQAAVKLQERGEEDVVFALAGDGKARPQLEKEVQRHGLTNVILMGPQDKYQINLLYRSAGAALVLFRNLPVLQTNSPNKFFDALAAGVPVIANMKGWIARLLEQHRAGIPIPPEDSEALVEAIITLRNEVDYRQELARNARHLAKTQFDRDRLAKQLEQVLLDHARNK